VRHPRAEIVLRDLERAYISLHYIYEDFEEDCIDLSDINMAIGEFGNKEKKLGVF
jgi:hypothetical protein